MKLTILLLLSATAFAQQPEQVYQKYCAGCHGDDAVRPEGPAVGGQAFGIGRCAPAIDVEAFGVEIRSKAPDTGNEEMRTLAVPFPAPEVLGGLDEQNSVCSWPGSPERADRSVELVAEHPDSGARAAWRGPGSHSAHGGQPRPRWHHDGFAPGDQALPM